MKNADIAPASILWLPDNGETNAIQHMPNGRLNHPVLVLSNPDIKLPSSTTTNIQILIITSFKETPLVDKFPGQNPWAKSKRSEYLPLKRSPPEPHPDSGLILEVRVKGTPQVPRNRQSYVHIVAPSSVANHHLKPLSNGTTRLSPEAFKLVLTKMKELHPTVVIQEDVVITKKPKKLLPLFPPPIVAPKTEGRTRRGEIKTQRRARLSSRHLASLQPVKPSKRDDSQDSSLSATSGPSGTTGQKVTFAEVVRPSHYTQVATATPKNPRYGTSATATPANSRYGTSTTATPANSRYGTSATATPANSRYGTFASSLPSSAPTTPPAQPTYNPYFDASPTYTPTRQGTSNYPRYNTPYSYAPHLERGGYTVDRSTRDDDCSGCGAFFTLLFFVAVVTGLVYFKGSLG
ncbi:hypothetical protein BDD12DRAFT_818901 [Trichophaea hybrida]|nr:hypothetical protein BDD12DRAFT_818901 [Trichophaea hybrida]